jgi:rod shape-determining protein MreD
VSARPVALSILLVLVAVVVQTTLFGPGRIQPLGAAPMLVLSVVMACVRYLDSEPALLLGFTAGLLLDLLGGSPLGLWAMVYVVITYLVLRVRHRAEEAVPVVALGVFLLALLAQVLFLVASTLFGQPLLSTSGLVKQLLLPALYTVAVSAAVFPLVTRLLRGHSVRTWVR